MIRSSPPPPTWSSATCSPVAEATAPTGSPVAGSQAVDLDVATLDAWIGDRLPCVGEPLHAERMGAGTGMANALFFVGRGAHEWVLRRPPPVVNAPGASDMVREWRVLGALEGTAVPHPQPLLLCEDVDVLGSPFLLMARVDGFTPVGILPSPFAGDAGVAGRRELSLAMVDAIAHLAQVDWRARRLVGFGKPDGFLDRQVPRWLAQLDRYRTREIPELEFVCTWLDGHRPTDRVSGIMHGDYSPFNVMIAPDRPGRVAAVVDWDTSTIGDPRLDIGHLLARWTEPGEEFVIGVDLEERGGLPSRAELASRYEASTGQALDHLPYFQALSLFKLAIILEGTYARLAAEGIVDPSRNTFTEGVPRLIRYAAAFARGTRS
jgi:aminoglycoside phosphotransferase (APT) family kinase protein